ncbi:MAG: TM0106 family RecB-like putative nuclease [Rhizomicrobium sp.]
MPTPSDAPNSLNPKRLSATRLGDFLGCAHKSALWLAGEPETDPADETQALLRTKGLEHEAAVLDRLEKAAGQNAVHIPTAGHTIEERIALTDRAIAEGIPIIYQGALLSDRWIGFPDFLTRDARAKDPVYRPEDAKLSRKAKRDHLLQIGLYAELLHRTNGNPIADGVVHVAAPEPELFDLRETQYITARLMRRFEAFAETKEKNTRAIRCAACERCGYKSRCENEWRSADSPIFVAGLQSSQLLKMEVAGVTTMSELAALTSGASIPGIGDETLAKLAAQARLQKHAQQSGTHNVETLPAELGKGFSLLPNPQPGDLFLDLEGDPLYPEGLEYLFGIYGSFEPAKTPEYKSFWAHDHAEEKTAFEAVMTVINEHLVKYPDARIYHYAQYEPAAFRRLAMRHATKEADLDQLLREHRFVDLYRVARQGIRASTESYSLKDLEEIYWGGRAGEVASAGDSIVQYERWRTTQEPTILAEIEKYNEEDCVSTAKMRDWLVGLRPADAPHQALSSGPGDDTASERSHKREEFERERQELAAGVRASDVANEDVRELVAELLWFHQRAQKPQWWSLFERQTWSDDELTDDAESLGGGTPDPSVPVVTVKRSQVFTCRFPPQDTKLKAGSTPVFAADLGSAGTIETIVPEDGVLTLKRGAARDPLPDRFSLLPGKPLDQRKLVGAVMNFAGRFASGDLGGDRALMDFLLRNPPSVKGLKQGENLLSNGEDLLSGTIRVIRNLDHTALFIQGPPGCGKTYVASHTIVALLQEGKRIAVSSNSHKAINKLLSEIEKRAVETGIKFSGAKKASRDDPETEFEGQFITSVQSSDDIDSSYQLVGGTVFHFSQEALGSYDYLFIDEAGQVALGNLVAMTGCAENLVLIGDQMQLAQPIQGVHPGETGLSALDYLLQHQATIDADKGILLNVTYRMHPALCQLVSDAIYDRRLTSHPSTAARRLILGANSHSALRPVGISFFTLEHEGCTQSSLEEALMIRTIVDDLTKQHFADGKEKQRLLTLDDILIVSPFNMQVNLLKRTLPDGARVGTVDKFQGQEAPVVVISMTTSHGDEAPRGTEFLFNRNRFNVAISRAQCLAIVVQSARLQDVSMGSIDDLIRLNLFARAEASATAR